MNENSATRQFRKDDIQQIVRLYEFGKQFLEECGWEKPARHFLEERLCLNGINMLQLLFYSNEKNKRTLAYTLLQNKAFHDACALKYRFPMKYEIPHILCKNSNYMMLRIFFICKKICSRFTKQKSVKSL